jgi:flagellar basal-body rod protein FlgB
MVQGIWAGGIYGLLAKGLDAASLRQRVSANNLANVNTPHFKRSFVEFERLLQEAVDVRGGGLAVTRPGHMGGKPEGTNEVVPVTVKDNHTSMRSDGNNVDVDREMTELAINQLYYNAVSQQLNDRLALMRYVINEGRR